MRTDMTHGGKAIKVRHAPLAVVIAIVLSSFGTRGLGADDSGMHWVSPIGTAPWSSCESATPLSGVAACTMATANKNAIAGDTINIRGGIYNTNIQPLRSGSAGNRITYRGYEGETVTITNVGNFGGIQLDGVDYVTVTNVTVQNVFQLVNIKDGSSYNEISHSTLSNGTGTANTGINIMTIRATDATKNTHNWLHHNVIRDAGSINASCDDSGGLINIGGDFDYDGISDHNTFEDNEIYWGAHHALKVNSRFNVIRNNFIHNEGHFVASAACKLQACAPDGVYGNRVLTVLNNHANVAAWFSDTFNLIENNRIGSAGLASDGNGADALTLGGERDIARYNTIYAAQEQGIFFRSAGNIADNNRVYNNTVAYNGQGPQCRVTAFPGFSRGGMRLPSGANGNVVKNNLLFGNVGAEIQDVGAGNVVSDNWLAAHGNPLFVNTSILDPMSATVPNLSLKDTSGAIDNGTSLTVANGAGASSTTLIVDDALYFQDGTRGSSLTAMQADWVAIGSVTNVVQISRIDYATNRITLVSAKSWSDGAPIWLYRDSDGTTILKGRAPDQGAHESGITSSTSAKPKAPTNVKVVP